MTAAGESLRPRLVGALGMAAIVLAVLGIYAGTLAFPFAFDDQLNITQNPGIRLGPDRGWVDLGLLLPTPRPVSNASFALNFGWGGYAVEGYRALNVGIHGVTSWCVAWLALLVLSRAERLGNQWGFPLTQEQRRVLGLFSGLVFAAHPLATQSVVYVVQRMTSLSTLFYVAGLCVWIASSDRVGGRRWGLRGVSLSLGVLSLGSKEIGATFPLALWLWEWGFERGGARRYVLDSVPWLLGLFGAGLLLLWGYTDGDPFKGYSSKPFTMWERLWTEPRVWWEYVGLSLWPWAGRLSLIHEVELSSGPWSPWTTWFSWLSWCGALLGAWWWSDRFRLWSALVVWWLLQMVVEGSVLPLEPLYEHRTYLPLVGLCVVAPWGLWSWARGRLGGVRRADRWMAGVGALVVLGLGASAWTRAQVWRDPLTLWSDARQKAPGHPIAQANWGVALLGVGRYEDARGAFVQALRIDPRNHTSLQNLGALEVGLGNFDEAEPYLRAALSIEPLDGLAAAGLGAVAMEQGRPDEAIALHRRALAITGDPRVQTNLGQILLMTGDAVGARREFTRSLALDPQQPVAVRKLGEAALALGDFSTAAAALEAARAMRSDWQHDPALLRDLERALGDAPDRPGGTSAPLDRTPEPSR